MYIESDASIFMGSGMMAVMKHYVWVSISPLARTLRPKGHLFFSPGALSSTEIFDFIETRNFSF